MQEGIKIKVASMPEGILGTGATTIFWLFAIIYLIVGTIVVYHWQRYGGKSKLVFVMETVYIVGSLALLVGAFLAIP